MMEDNFEEVLSKYPLTDEKEKELRDDPFFKAVKVFKNKKEEIVIKINVKSDIFIPKDAVKSYEKDIPRTIAALLCERIVFDVNSDLGKIIMIKLRDILKGESDGSDTRI